MCLHGAQVKHTLQWRMLIRKYVSDILFGDIQTKDFKRMRGSEYLFDSVTCWVSLVA
jgi:hypothetical protein